MADSQLIAYNIYNPFDPTSPLYWNNTGVTPVEPIFFNTMYASNSAIQTPPTQKPNL